MPEVPRESPLRAGSAWDRLFALLAPEPARAQQAYAGLRRRLVDVFRWRGLPAAEDLADETFDRAVKRLAEGLDVRDVAGFVLGIAHRLTLESARRDARHEPLDESSADLPAVAPAEPDDGRDTAWLERCLGELPGPTQALLLDYYGGRGHARITRRKQLAQDLGVGQNALRIRLHRLRQQLLECVARCRDVGAPA